MELRVHGIGGPSAAAVLDDTAVTARSAPAAPAHTPAPDLPPPARWRSDPTGHSALRSAPARADVAAYHWSPLTSGSKFFALWPLLLPFTVINVAGHLAPGGSPGRARAVRGTAAVLGWVTTMAWGGWALLAGQILLDGVGRRPWPGLALGVALAILPFGVALYSSRGFENVAPVRPAAPGPHSTGLCDPDFFGGKGHGRRVAIHAAGLLVLVTAVATSTAEGFGARVLDGASRTITATWAAQGVLLGVLLVAGWRGLRPRDGSWGGSPAFAAAATGVVLLGGMMSAALQWWAGSCPPASALPPGPPPDACTVLTGRPWMVVDVFGWVLLVALAMAVTTALHTLLRPAPIEKAAAGAHLLSGYPGRLRARVALWPRALVPTLTAGAVAFLAIGSMAFIARSHLAGTPQQCADLPFADASGSPCEVLGRAHPPGAWRLTDSPPVSIARWSFLALAVFMGLNLVKSRARGDVLRRVGSIWDVLTFWPRSVHPLAVRSYGERTVPELQRILVERRGIGPGPVVITAHNQGSVLVVAALAPFATANDPTAGLHDLRLLTLGSPLRSLYAAAFPAYVDDALIEALRAWPSQPPDWWRNAFRPTDHVGRSVFVPDARWSPASTADRGLADPRAAGLPVDGDNDYWRDPRVKALVHEFEQERET